MELNILGMYTEEPDPEDAEYGADDGTRPFTGHLEWMNDRFSGKVDDMYGPAGIRGRFFPKEGRIVFTKRYLYNEIDQEPALHPYPIEYEFTRTGGDIPDGLPGAWTGTWKIEVTSLGDLSGFTCVTFFQRTGE